MITDAGDVPATDGLRIRSGQIFRVSGGLVSDDELKALEHAGLRRIVDLRGTDENRAMVRDWAEAKGVDYISEPIPAASKVDFTRAATLARTNEEAEKFMSDLYRLIVDNFGAQLTATIGAMADGLPAGYGCAAGKDRTGIVTAFLHVVLGVPKEEVARRYVDSAPSAERLDVLTRDFFDLPDDEPLPAGVAVLTTTRQATILDTLAHVEETYGGVEEYLRRHGLPDAAADTLREQLLVAE